VLSGRGIEWGLVGENFDGESPLGSKVEALLEYLVAGAADKVGLEWENVFNFRTSFK